MSHQEKFIELQEQNLFDLPIQNSDNQFGGGDDNEFEDILHNPHTDANIKLDQIRDEIIESTSNMTGGSIQSPPQLFDTITLEKENEISMIGGSEISEVPATNSLLETVQEPNVSIPQTGGANLNLEGFDISDMDDKQQIDDYGNVDNPGEDAPNVDDDQFDEQVDEEKEPQSWFHPELSLEEDPEMVAKMNHTELEGKVNVFLDNYNSHEYQEYLKYFQAIHSASSQKYSIRRDNEGSIYLVKRSQPSKDLKGKKHRESVYDIINDSNFKTNYMIKLTPPEYLNINDEILKITKELNVLSGDIKVLQNDLIDLGSNITKDDIKKFEKARQKFYKLINKKHIYTKYYNEVNGIFDEKPQHNISAKEIITETDENDIKIYKLKYHVVGVSDEFINATTSQIKNNLDNYTQIINDDGNNEKEYNNKIKTYLDIKNENENKIKKELNGLISVSKSRINFLIKKLPKIDIKSEII